MQPTRFPTITLAAPDPDTLAAFYSETLGLPARLEDGTAIVQAGVTALQFEHGAGAPFYHFAFNVPPQRIEDARAWLAERVPLLRHVETGEEVVAFTHWNAFSVYFHDPAGNIVELIARHDLSGGHDENIGHEADIGRDRKSVDDVPFGPGHILGLSEIALVVDDVPGTVSGIREAFGLPVYGGDEGDEVFTAMGDVRGLVLAIRADWPWLPEKSRFAEAHPVRLAIECDSTVPRDAVWRFGCYEIRVC